MASRPARTTADGVDLSEWIDSAAALIRAGKVFAVRYVSPNTTNHPHKRLTAAERDDCRAHDVDLCVVWETTATRATAGRAAGAADARAADAVVRALGMTGMPIHWAIDFDATGAQVEAYARGWVDELGVDRCGAYGGIKPLAYLLDRHLITYAWQTYAWSAGQIEPRATAYQWQNDVTVAGNNVDLDAALAHDYGQWPRPFNPPDQGVDMALTDADAKVVWDHPLHNDVTGQDVPASAFPRSINTGVNDLRTAQVPALAASLAKLADAVAKLPTADQIAAAVVAALPTAAGGSGAGDGVTAAELAAADRAAADVLDPPTAGASGG